MKKFAKISLITLAVLLLIVFVAAMVDSRVKYYMNLGLEQIKHVKGVKVIEEYSKVDKNNNGKPDCLDIVATARKEAENKTVYKDAYYKGGYPPDTEGVCTDVVWRGLKGIGVDLKTLVDKDIKENTSVYPRITGKPDTNIDFRRVKNLDVFFKRNADSATTELKPFDAENLKQWQPGDIVIIMKPFEHIAVVSDVRDENGVPKVIHNTSPHAVENSSLTYWVPYIYAHYRWKY